MNQQQRETLERETGKSRYELLPKEERAKLQSEAIAGAYEGLPEEERKTVDGVAKDLTAAIKQDNPNGQAGEATIIEILGALGMFLEKDGAA